MRYSDQRDDPDARAQGLREGEPRLFAFNQLLIRTCGEATDAGSITATDDKYFYPWQEIYPPEHRAYTPPLGQERAQEILIQGILPPAVLLDIVRHCVLFLQTGGRTVKITPRYQQYRAIRKIIARLLGEDGSGERSGVIWHTQGSGKSLTMVFTVRRMRTTAGLHDYKVIMVNDRTDLEDQLTGTAQLTGEPVHVVEFGSDAMRARLGSTTSDLNMVMIHKFQEQDEVLPAYAQAALGDGKTEKPTRYQFPDPNRPLTRAAEESLKVYKAFEVVNASSKIAVNRQKPSSTSIARRRRSRSASGCATMRRRWASRSTKSVCWSCSTAVPPVPPTATSTFTGSA